MKRLLAAALVGGLVLTLLADLMLSDPHYGYHWWSQVTGWDLVFGFVGCLVLLFGAKALGKYLVQRPEDYYDQR